MCAAILHRLRHRSGIALLDMERGVARRLVPERRRAVGERRTAIDDRRQRLVVDLDELGGFACDLRAVGDDERHRVADMAHAIDGQRVARRHDQRRHRRQAGHRAEAGQIGGGVDAVHAGALPGSGCIDAA